MTRRHTALTALCIAVVLLAALPVLSAAKRGRPMGPYKYTIVATSSFRGQSITSRDRGKLTLSGRRIVGRSRAGDSFFTLKSPSRLTRAARQNAQASGKWTVIDPRFGVSTGRINASVRVQKTRRGTWKLSGNYTGRITKGRARGATQTGRFTARSI
jgi:hypothetical protein